MDRLGWVVGRVFVRRGGAQLGACDRPTPTRCAERDGRVRAAAAWLMVAGTVLFCGSIYARALGVSPGIVAAAPYGGVAFMVGWLAFAASPWIGGKDA